MGRTMKWWCRLTVRWWTPGSSTSKAPLFLLTSEIIRGTKPTPSLVPLPQPQRRPMWSAPFLSRYSSSPSCTGKKAEEWSAALCPMASGELPRAATQGKRKRTRSCSDFHHLPIVWTVLAREQSSRRCSHVAMLPGGGYPVIFHTAFPTGYVCS